MTLEEYLLSLVEGAALSVTQKVLSPDERAAAFEAWSASHLPTPHLSNYAVSRESMYEDLGHSLDFLSALRFAARKPMA